MPNVLMLNDNPQEQLLLGQNLEKGGYTVTKSSDVNEALSLAKNQNFDLYIVKLQFSSGDSGYRFIRRARDQKKIASNRFLILNGKRYVPEIKKLKEQGFLEFLSTPVSPADFVYKVRSMITQLEIAQNSQAKSPPKSTISNQSFSGLTGFINNPIQIISLTKTGCIVEVDFEISRALNIRLKVPSLEQIGITELAVRFIKCESKGSKFHLYFQYVNPPEKLIQFLSQGKSA